MKPFVIGCALVCSLHGTAFAENRTRTVKAGQTTVITVHTSWDPVHCGSTGGVVRVLEKPRHGKLANRMIQTTITGSRFGAVRNCLGKPTRGFRVEYTPARGFRGIDTFRLDVTWDFAGGRHEIDTYTVTVE